jgi:heme-degrading monooxygenase HmoA
MQRWNAWEDKMIARMWRGRAETAKADAYCRHFTTNVVPHLKDLAGHRGAYLLKRQIDGEVEFVAVTLWESLEAIKRFAGPDPSVAIVEPEGRAALSTYDDRAQHYEVAYWSAE